ncbi:MAG: ATPase [Salinibacterium sp.]|nr:ATPase [Salinibacterium sp.]
MRVDVGVDGGQSQVRLSVVGRDGVATSEGVAHSDGDAVELLVAAVANAWAQVRRDEDEIHRIVLGITTMPPDAPTRERLAAAVSAATGAQEVWLVGDAVTAHLGALPSRHGVVLVVGTGIACLAIDAGSGRVRRVDGDGYLLGDGGASFWIGRHGLAAALASYDGRGSATTLAAAAVERFGSLESLAAAVHALERPVNAVAQFAAVVQDHARDGDPIARGIVRDAASQLVSTALAAATICNSDPVPVALLGRAVGPGTPLRSEVERSVAQQTTLVLVEAAGGPLDGALRLASGAAPEAYEQFLSKWSTR